MNAKDVAQYFISKDEDGLLFNTTNRRKFYERNARLNKYLFLAQVVYLAKYDKCLFADDFKAYVNGPVIEDIMSWWEDLQFFLRHDKISLSEKVLLFKIVSIIDILDLPKISEKTISSLQFPTVKALVNLFFSEVLLQVSL